MKQVSYLSNETFFVTGRDIADARERFEAGVRDETPLGAWNDLDYWDREEHPEQFEVFEFHIAERITKVDPPYSRS